MQVLTTRRGKEMNSLEEVIAALKTNDARVTDDGGWRTDLPTFGGPIPDDTTEVWSWDEERLIVGTCSNDVEIVPRDQIFGRW